jgi:hypothetical protein
MKLQKGEWILISGVPKLILKLIRKYNLGCMFDSWQTPVAVSLYTIAHFRL